MSKRWVADASPIIVLAKIGHIHLLPALSDELIVPSAVAKEIENGVEGDPAKNWLREDGRRFAEWQDPSSPTVLSWDLGRGETAVLSWAYEHPGYEVIVDDNAARTCAQSLGIPVRGTIGLILLAKRTRAIEQAMPLIDRAIGAGLHVSADVLQAARQLAGED